MTPESAILNLQRYLEVKNLRDEAHRRVSQLREDYIEEQSYANSVRNEKLRKQAMEKVRALNYQFRGAMKLYTHLAQKTNEMDELLQSTLTTLGMQLGHL